MAFIDIFNFKKYFSKPSDSQVARYGHVNALYDALSTASSFTTAKYLFENINDSPFDITSSAGQITFSDSSIGMGNTQAVQLNASFITENSIIVASVGCNPINSSGVVVRVSTEEGTAEIRITNVSATSDIDTISINYIIIN